MNLQDVLQRVLSRFTPDNPVAPANDFVFGFVAPDEAPLSLVFSIKEARLEGHVKEAEYLLFASVEVFAALLNPDTPHRAALVDQVRLSPDLPFKNYLLSILLNTFHLEIPDLDYKAKLFNGPFPFPPRYPIAQNPFRQRTYQPTSLPTYDANSVPMLIADDHPAWVAMFNKAWQIAFKNLRQPEPQSGFISNFIDPAFNYNTYLWDSCFMTMFGKYAARQFPFIGTLDNFYAKQHDDGFICREINTYSGTDLYQSLDPRSTGPNILAWAEWQHYQISADKSRLRDVFFALIAFHRWWKDWRTHPDGSYWTSGWGSGMDNQTRVPRSEIHHRHASWVDATFQQALNCRLLLNIANAIGEHEFDDDLQSELAHLTTFVNERLWDEASGFYYDRTPDGLLTHTKSIGAYWGLLSEVVPPDRAKRMIEHLRDTTKFNRPHRVPTQSADSEVYHPYGGYWLGGVWSPTNYMVLFGLIERQEDALAHEIALNHVKNVAAVFADTGTLWENYAPEHPEHGKPASRDFVGWTGLSAISIPLEYLIGLRATTDGLLWDIRLSERHGVLRYPQGHTNTVDLICEASYNDTPRQLTIRTRNPFTLIVQRGNVRKQWTLDAGEHRIEVAH
jgi:hypothetical protein